MEGDLPDPFIAEVISRVDCGGVEGISSITILMAGISDGQDQKNVDMTQIRRNNAP